MREDTYKKEVARVAKRDEDKALIALLLKELKGVEWPKLYGFGDEGTCPSCKHGYPDHHKDCTLSQAIKRAEGGEK